MTDVWNVVHRERLALIDDLERIDSDQWNAASLCDGWSVHDVLAHLVNDAKTTKVNFILAMFRARFNFDRLNQNGVDYEKRNDPKETLDAFRSVADRTSSAPAPLATRFVEIIVHGEDIRRPLGISHDYPVQAVIEAMTYQANTSASMGGSKERVERLHLIANDADWSHGSGLEVRGRAIDLLIAITGRSVAEGTLTGEGIAKLTSKYALHYATS